MEDATPPAPQPDAEPSDADEEFGTECPAFNELMKSICEFVVEWTRQKLAPHDERITRLEAKVETLIGLLGQKSGNVAHGDNNRSDVVDLPNWRRDVA